MGSPVSTKVGEEVRNVVEELEVTELDDYTLCFCCGFGCGGGIK